MKQYVYFYFMKNEPEKICRIVPEHIAYWRNCNALGYKGGPFADRSGGMISFSAAVPEEAERLIAADPFVLEGLMDNKWLKEWLVE
jgi:hypothetical protein